MTAIRRSTLTPFSADTGTMSRNSWRAASSAVNGSSLSFCGTLSTLLTTAMALRPESLMRWSAAAVRFMARLSARRSPRCNPGVSTNAICTPGRLSTPSTRCRVVWGREVTMETFSPTSAFSSVDLPTLGRPTSAAKPARNAAASDMTQRLQRRLCRHLLGAAAAAALAFGLDAGVGHNARHPEDLHVRLAAGALDGVHGQRMPIRLQEFLQARLGVFERGRFRQCRDARLEQRFDALADRFHAAVEIQRAANRLEGIGQDGRSAETAGFLFAGSEEQQVAELHRQRDLRQRLLAHQARAQSRQVAFAGAGKFAVQPLREQQVQHRVAEEFETFVVRPVGTAMRERYDEQRTVARLVAQAGGEHVRLGFRRGAHGCRGIQLMTTVDLKLISRNKLPNMGAVSS